jgi:hypothetical protein
MATESVSPSKLAILRTGSPLAIPSSGGVINWIRDVFKMTSLSDFDVMGGFDEQNESQRVEIAEKLYAFYQGSMEEIGEYLTSALARTFTAQDVAEFQMVYLPVARRIIEKVCKVYAGGVERYLSSDAATEKLEEVLESSDIETKQVAWHRYAKLFDTVLVQPVMREIQGKRVLQFDIWTPNKTIVIEKQDNFMEPDAVVYAIQRRNDKGEPELNYVYWSEQRHFMTTASGKRIENPENADGVNPFQILPFVVLRMRETENFWGEGQTILVNIEEKIDVLLIQLMDLLIMQSHGQPVLTNAKVEGSVQTGPKHPLVLLPHDPAQPASFTFESTQAKIQEVTQAIDWLIERAATMYGLSKTALMEQSQASSGYAKMLDSWDMFEIRNEDIGILTEFEKRLYRVVQKVLAAEGIALPEETLGVEFGDYQFPIDPQVEMDVKKAKKELGLWTPIYDLMDNGMTEEEAIAELAKIKELNKGLSNASGNERPIGGTQSGDDTLESDGMSGDTGEVVSDMGTQD